MASKPLTPQQSGMLLGATFLVATIAGCAYVQFVAIPAPVVQPLSDIPEYQTGVVSDLGPNGVFYRVLPYMDKRGQVVSNPTISDADIGKQSLAGQ